jgi:CRP-like cAMP-binding protein
MPTIVTEPTLSGESLRAALAPFQLFRAFDEADWKALLAAVANPTEEIEVRQYLKEEVIRRKGEFDLSFCVVLKGNITLMRKLPGEPAQKSATFSVGEFYGEECALSGLQRYVDVRAARDSQVLCVSPAALKWIDGNKEARELIKQQYNQRANAEVCEDLGLFAEIPVEVLRKLTEMCEEPLKIPTGGQLILKEGQLTDTLHVIRSGFVEAFYKRKEDNTIRVVTYLRAGDFFGETLLENKPLQWSLRSTDRCEIIRIPGDQLHKIAREYPQVALRVHESLQLRERLEQKLTDALAEEIERFGGTNLIGNARSTYPPRAGVTPGVLTDALAEEIKRFGEKNLVENAQFTVYRPRAVTPDVWVSLLVFAHLAERSRDDEPDPIEEVRNQARRILGEHARDFTSVVADSSQSIPRFGEISFVPEVEGFEFNPPRRTFRWIENVHREDFRCRASASMVGRTARGRLTVLFGSIIIAEVALSIRVEAELRAPVSSEPAEAVHARPYRKIFASYSHLDSHVVEQVALFTKALGDDYLLDVKDLHAGEVWNARLEEMIHEADIFQLFWSSNSMRSRFVRQEWECALGLQRKNFIRPTYWEVPLPESPAEHLPPESLRSLHFHRLAGIPPPSTRSATGALPSLADRAPAAEPPDDLNLRHALEEVKLGGVKVGGFSKDRQHRLDTLARGPSISMPRSDELDGWAPPSSASSTLRSPRVAVAAIVIIFLIAILAILMFRMCPRAAATTQIGDSQLYNLHAQAQDERKMQGLPLPRKRETHGGVSLQSSSYG